MPTINVKLCSNCMQGLITKNPYVDYKGRPISFKGVKLKKVSAEFCDHRVRGKCHSDKVVLEAMRCGNCQKEYYIKLGDGRRPICPSCRSMHMIPMKEEELR